MDGILKAFISSTDFDELIFSTLLGSLEGEDVEISYEKLEIENRNWNASWEANFDPVEIAQQLYIRAPFHEQKENFEFHHYNPTKNVFRNRASSDNFFDV